MQIFALVSGGCFVAVSLVVGFRLLRLAWRTHLAPEFAIGTQIFLQGGIGYPLWILGSRGAVPAALMPLPETLAPLALGLGTVALFLGAWRIFRPTETWAGVLAVLGSTAVMAAAIYDVLTAVAAFSETPLTFWIGDLSRIASFTWVSVESFHHFRMMRRRHRIGLAEPALANRFLLWGLAAGCGALVVTGTIVNSFVYSLDTVGAPILLSQSILGVVASTLIWLTFYPPRVLEGVLLQRAAAGAGSDG